MRISFGKNFLWVRNNRLYRGIGGNKANGAGFRPRVDPAAVAIADRLNDSRMIGMTCAFKNISRSPMYVTTFRLYARHSDTTTSPN